MRGSEKPKLPTQVESGTVLKSAAFHNEYSLMHRYNKSYTSIYLQDPISQLFKIQNKFLLNCLVFAFF